MVAAAATEAEFKSVATSDAHQVITEGLNADAATVVPAAEAMIDAAATESNTDVATAAAKVTTDAIAAAAKFTSDATAAAATAFPAAEAKFVGANFHTSVTDQVTAEGLNADAATVVPAAEAIFDAAATESDKDVVTRMKGSETNTEAKYPTEAWFTTDVTAAAAKFRSDATVAVEALWLLLLLLKLSSSLLLPRLRLSSRQKLRLSSPELTLEMRLYLT